MTGHLLDPLVFWSCAWQTTACLVIGGLFSFLWSTWPARAHRVLLLAVIAALLAPVFTGAVHWMGWGLFPHPEPSLIPATMDYRAPSLEPSPGPRAVSDDVSTESSEPPTSTPSSQSASLFSSIFSALARIALNVPFWMKAFYVFWAVLSVFVALRLILSLIQEIRILRSARPVHDEQLLQAVQGAAEKLGIQTVPGLYRSDRIHSPVIAAGENNRRCYFPPRYSTRRLQPILRISCVASWRIGNGVITWRG